MMLHQKVWLVLIWIIILFMLNCGQNSYSYFRTHFREPLWIQIVTQDSEFRSSKFKNLAILTNSLLALFIHF